MASEVAPRAAVGFTGRRFGGDRGRGRHSDAPGGDADHRPAGDPVSSVVIGVVQAPDVSEAPVVGLTGARFGGRQTARRRRPVAPTVVRPVTARAPRPEPEPEPEPEGWDTDDASSEVSATVRPYVLTSGRTRSTFELPIEALVSAAPGTPMVHSDIVELCREPRSVAEIAALRGVPLGVARVLLGDLAAVGAITVHRTVDAGGPDLALMERVLSGLRRL
jgi:hypothetical protein